MRPYAGRLRPRFALAVYYYRSNYFVWFVFCFVVSFFRHPLAFFAIGLVTFTALLSNDSFSHSVRRARPHDEPLIGRSLACLSICSCER